MSNRNDNKQAAIEAADAALDTAGRALHEALTTRTHVRRAAHDVRLALRARTALTDSLTRRSTITTVKVLRGLRAAYRRAHGVSKVLIAAAVIFYLVYDLVSAPAIVAATIGAVDATIRAQWGMGIGEVFAVMPPSAMAAYIAFLVGVFAIPGVIISCIRRARRRHRAQRPEAALSN